MSVESLKQVTSLRLDRGDNKIYVDFNDNNKIPPEEAIVFKLDDRACRTEYWVKRPLVGSKFHATDKNKPPKTFEQIASLYTGEKNIRKCWFTLETGPNTFTSYLVEDIIKERRQR